MSGANAPGRWKAQIVAESLQPGALVVDVALRYGMRRKQVYAWRQPKARDMGHTST